MATFGFVVLAWLALGFVLGVSYKLINYVLLPEAYEAEEKAIKIGLMDNSWCYHLGCILANTLFGPLPLVGFFYLLGKRYLNYQEYLAIVKQNYFV